MILTTTIYQIVQTGTGVVLFYGEANDEQHALDLMAEDAGYADYADACGCQNRSTDECRAELSITKYLVG